jgi:hypothetical protein
MQIKVKKDVKKCPQCQNIMEWVGGKVDNTEQEYMCKPCRIYVIIQGFTEEQALSIVRNSSNLIGNSKRN